MASIVDFASLKTAMAEWLWRAGDSSVTGRAEDFIALFEADFTSNPEMRTYEMEKVSNLTLSGSSVALPADFLEMIRAQITTLTPPVPLSYRTPSAAAILDANASTIGGTARYFTTLASNLIVTPQAWAPNGATLELAYYAFQPLSNGNTTNWLLTKYPHIYLYGSLMQASAYIDDDKFVSKWSAGLADALNKLALSDKKRKLGGGPLVVGASADFLS